MLLYIINSLHIFNFLLYYTDRPEYGLLKKIAAFFHTVLVVALTATAPPAVRDELSKALQHPQCAIASVDIIQFNPHSRPGMQVTANFPYSMSPPLHLFTVNNRNSNLLQSSR